MVLRQAPTSRSSDNGAHDVTQVPRACSWDYSKDGALCCCVALVRA